jgi:hypothetical protein
MSDEPSTVPCRVCTDSLVRGMCMDCHEEFAGQLALTLVLRGDVLGLLVQIVVDDHMHSIARVPLHIIPLVGH